MGVQFCFFLRSIHISSFKMAFLGCRLSDARKQIYGTNSNEIESLRCLYRRGGRGESLGPERSPMFPLCSLWMDIHVSLFQICCGWSHSPALVDST